MFVFLGDGAGVCPVPVPSQVSVYDVPPEEVQTSLRANAIDGEVQRATVPPSTLGYVQY